MLCPIRKTWGFAELPFARPGNDFTAANPPNGALISYHLREDVKGKLSLKVADSDGKVIREIPAPATAGLHRVAWDLRAGGAGGGGGFRGGAIVKPGKYTVTLEKLIEKNATQLGEPQVCEVVPISHASATAQP